MVSRPDAISHAGNTIIVWIVYEANAGSRWVATSVADLFEIIIDVVIVIGNLCLCVGDGLQTTCGALVCIRDRGIIIVRFSSEPILQITGKGSPVASAVRDGVQSTTGAPIVPRHSPERIVNAGRMPESVVPCVAPAAQPIAALFRIKPIPNRLLRCPIWERHCCHPIQVIVIVSQGVACRVGDGLHPAIPVVGKRNCSARCGPGDAHQVSVRIVSPSCGFLIAVSCARLSQHLAVRVICVSHDLTCRIRHRPRAVLRVVR